MRLEIACPAKLNPFLAVGPIDSHGYHPIRTILQAVSLFDTLILDDEAEPGFFCSAPDVPPENTVTKAIRMVSEISVVPPLRVELIKRIPSQAGMGGGSSDAAGFLRAINRFLQAPISRAHLMDAAVAVGMDTAFFMVGGRARGEHYGEVLTPLPDGPEQWFVIVKPEVGMPSGAAYRALDSKQPFEFREFPAGDELYNDFERVAPCECLDLIEVLRSRGCTAAGLTGSGSAVFGLASSREEGERIAGQFPGAVCAQSLGRAESVAV